MPALGAGVLLAEPLEDVRQEVRRDARPVVGRPRTPRVRLGLQQPDRDEAAVGARTSPRCRPGSTPPAGSATDPTSSGSRRPGRGSTSTAMSRALRPPAARARQRAAIASAGSNHCRSSSSLPDVIRDTSSRSAISWAWTRALRSMALTPRDHVGVVARRRAAEQLRPADDRVERRPQLVRQRRQEVVLEPVGALRPRPARARLAGQQPLPLGFDPPRSVTSVTMASRMSGPECDRDAPFEFDVAAVGVSSGSGAAPRPGRRPAPR